MNFDQHVATFRHRMRHLKDTFDRQRYLFARSQHDPSYTILLQKGFSNATFEVHSFRDGQSIGHRGYDRLDGGGPTQNALQEFAGQDMKLEQRPRPAKDVEWSDYLGRER